MDNKNFWKRIDNLVVTNGINYKVLSEESGIPYITIMNQKNQYSRLPKLEDAFSLAKALGTTVEYLLTGDEGSSYPPRIKSIADHLCVISNHDLDTVETMVMALPASQAKYSTSMEA